MKPDPQAVNYQFGVFELSGKTGELRKNGMIIRLPPQPTQVLKLLVSREGELVTRDELEQALWKGDTIVDFELGLNRCIRRIRAVLLDDAQTPRYVETIPRVGYRFIAPIRVVMASPKSAPKAPDPELPRPSPVAATVSDIIAPPTTPVALPPSEPAILRPVSELLLVPAAQKPPARNRIRIAAGIAVALGLVGFLIYRQLEPAVDTEVRATYRIEPFTSEPGLVASPAFSPDGNQIAFTWNGKRQDDYDIYIKTLGSQQTTRLTKSPDLDFGPAWSPDGKFIAFCRSGDGKTSSIWLISLADGTERRLVEQWSVAPNSRFLTWSPDSRRLVFSGSATEERVSGLLEIDVASGSMKFLTQTKNGVFDLQPAYSPDGRRVVFVRDIGRGIGRIFILPMKPDGGAAGEAVALQWPGFESAYVGSPVWTPDSESILFASNRNPEQYLWMVKAKEGATPQMLGSLGSGILDAAMSPTGELALVHERLDIDVAKLDLAALRRGDSADPEIVVNSTRVETNPKVSADGSRVAFESNRSGPMEIWAANVDGTNLAKITNIGHANTGSPAWSPDGSQIAFDSRSGGSPRIYVLPAMGGKVEPVTDIGDLGVVPAWSSDGAWIYFASDRAGHPEIWRVPAKGGSRHQVTKNGGFSPVSMGNRLWFSSNRSKVTSLNLLNLDTNQETTLATDVLRRAYHPATDGMYYISSEGAGRYALKFMLGSQPPAQTLYRFSKPVADGLGVSPDGRFAFFGLAEQVGSDLLLVRDFWHR